MENNERDRKLDQWLDEALSEYSAAEPRFGLEQRVLKRIRGEEQRSRKWILWRWMPALGAIAAVITVAVAVRPMLEKKTAAQRTDARMDAYLVHSEEKGAAAKVLTNSKATPLAHSNQPAAELDRKHTSAPHAAQPQPRSSDRDALSTSTVEAGSLDSRQSNANKPVTATNEKAVTTFHAAAPLEVAPPPPPPPPPQRSVDKDTGETAVAAPVSKKPEAPQSTAQPDELRAPNGIVAVETLSDKSLAAMEPKDRKRKRERANADAARQDTNVMEVFGVKVRFENYPTAHQFPTPAPLSNQERLALAAGRGLEGSDDIAHKSPGITPIQIKKLEIKPLEGPEKEK